MGSGDAFGSGGRFQTCFGLSDAGHSDVHTLIDCGATSLTALHRLGIDPLGVDTVLITHLHGDHFGGLPFLILDGQFRRRNRDLTVIGPPGTAAQLAECMEALFPGSAGVQRRFMVVVREHADRRPMIFGAGRVVPVEVRHATGAPAYALRIEAEGATVAYSGDTEWTEALPEVSQDADLFLCEGYRPTPVQWHLDLATLAEHRHRLRCRRLLLTHLSQAALDTDLTGWEVAYDGQTVDLTRP